MHRRALRPTFSKRAGKTMIVVVRNHRRGRSMLPRYISDVVPAKAGIHTPCRFNLNDGAATAVGKHRRQGVWVPAFAGTTAECAATAK